MIKGNLRSCLAMATPYLLLLAVAVASRLLPHPPNMTAVGALGLYAGAVLHGSWRWLAPLCALGISDMLLGFYNPALLVFVYTGSMMAILCSRLPLILACFSAAVLFFVVSNLGVWICTDMYQPDFSGLLDCYIAALPFFGNTVAGNLLYYPAMRYADAFMHRSVFGLKIR